MLLAKIYCVHAKSGINKYITTGTVNYCLGSKLRIGLKYQPTDYCFYMCRVHEFHIRSSRLRSDGEHVHGQRVSVRVQDIWYVGFVLNTVLMIKLSEKKPFTIIMQCNAVQWKTKDLN